MHKYNLSRYNLSLSKKQNGLSLIELMIALGLGIVVIFGVTQSLISMSLSSRVQSRNAELLETADSALSYISFRMRNALSTPCERYAKIDSTELHIQGLAGNFGGEDISAPQATAIADLINGTAAGQGLGITVTSTQVSRDFGAGNNDYGTDNITLVSIGDRLTPETDVTFKTTAITIDGTFVSPRVGNNTLYAITDCKKMDIFRASRTVNSGKTSLGFMGVGTPTGTNIESAYRVADLSIISPLDVAEISVNSNGNLIDKTIFKNSGGALMNNVDLIRILFGVDHGGDGITDQYVTANQLNTLVGSTIMSADIFMLVRVPTADAAYSDNYTVSLPNTSQAIGAGSSSNAMPEMEEITITDKVQRKVFMRSVVFRNNAITL